METAVFDAHELPLVLSALRSVVPRPSARHHKYLDAVARSNGGLRERRALPPAPHMLVAGVIRDARRRKRLVQLGVLMALVDPQTLTESAPNLANLANALDVDEPAVGALAMLASRPPLSLCAAVMCRSLTSSISSAWKKGGVRGLSRWLKNPLSSDRLLAAHERLTRDLSQHPRRSLARALAELRRESDDARESTVSLPRPPSYSHESRMLSAVQ